MKITLAELKTLVRLHESGNGYGALSQPDVREAMVELAIAGEKARNLLLTLRNARPGDLDQADLVQDALDMVRTAQDSLSVLQVWIRAEQ